MDLKAFNKLYSEAVEAIAERRVLDAISLVEAIYHDIEGEKPKAHLDRLYTLYEWLLQNFTAGHHDEEKKTQLNQLFQTIIEGLQAVRFAWLTSHRATSYGRIAAQLTDLTSVALADQVRRTTRGHLGELAYTEALDAAFGIAWCCNTKPIKSLLNHLQKADNFTRRVLVGGLLLGILDRFSTDKIELLLSLGTMAMNDLNNVSLIEDDDERETLEQDTHDLLARICVAMTLVVQHNGVFLVHYEDLNERVKAFFHSDLVRSEMPTILHAFVCQSLTDRVGKRVDDILTIIKDVVEDQQPHLGSSSKETKSEKGMDFDIQVTKIELKAGKKLFEKMANYAASVDAMRQNDMDVNHSNFTHMKRFDFFDHSAHWFYPFSLDEAAIQAGIHHPDGKLDVMTLSIMDHSRFCDSDRYSYASMMAFLRRDGKHAISDSVRDQIEEMREDDDDDELPFDLNESAEWRLDSYVNFCQVCYRFFHSQHLEKEYAYTFAPSDDIILPLLPYFEGLFTDFEEIKDSVEAYLHMGDNEHAIVLLNYMMEHSGTTAYALELKGRALMQMRQWRSAISCFQQRLLIEEDPDSQLAMARCYEALQDWDSALPLLIEEDQRQESKDADIIEEIARCLIQLNRWEDAVQRFFQLELMGEHLSVSQRGIGWCSLHQGKYERAEQYYRKLIDKARRAQWEDHINLGHALWLQGRTAEAVDAYRQFAATFNRTKKAQRHHFRHWTEAFHEDAHTLLSTHFSEQELALMQDAIALK